ncbi:radical SAM protein [Candidatus Nitrosocosmicus hydrocola]|uniref:radical SAM protein n=1 Tax=Candidatus Nitrosocosmicus hydrocola TaxID=1826872 RepID=UPI0011E6063B|nr:radical SAM protein [Candidatus Nitrosocosmicus hydrocola]
MVVDTIHTLKLLGTWAGNRNVQKRCPLIAVFSLTHYCNYYCPMCPFGESDKTGQIKFAKSNNPTNDQWKMIFDKTSKYCIWSIVEGGEPTSRPDIMELVKYLYEIKMPVTVISNCSLLNKLDLLQLRRYIQFITCSIDSVHKDSYCKVRGVNEETFEKVVRNIRLLQENDVPHYFNSVITKFNSEEFIDQTYFEKAIELGSDAFSLTFV